MAFKRASTTASNATKQYLWLMADLGAGFKRWGYVTADAPATVEVSGYFGAKADTPGMTVGDELIVFQAAAIDDTRSLKEDLAAGLVDISRHFILTSDGSGIELTPDLEVATVTYTS